MHRIRSEFVRLIQKSGQSSIDVPFAGAAVSHEAMKQNGKPGCLLIVIGVSAFCMISALVVSFIGETPNRNDSGAVSEAFVRSLIRNDAGLARSLVAPEQLPRIDKWMAQHAAYYCRVKFLDLEGEMMYGIGIHLDKENIENWGYTYVCSDTGYRFELQNINLRRTGNGYQVIEWSELCEARGWDEELKCD